MNTHQHHEPLSPHPGLPPFDEGTLEASQEGTLSDTPEPVPLRRPPPLQWVGLALALVAVFSLRGPPPAAEPFPARSAQHGSAAAFEAHLTLVRHDPLGAGHRALAEATVVSLALAREEAGIGLWTERAAAAAERYALYWPGDPLTPVLVEETAVLLAERGATPEALALLEQLPCLETR